jgi:D-beta-D-heptose 7-phosphate kinase/D-beta-D-heptose 1-phosphate adenosyltransferase
MLPLPNFPKARVLVVGDVMLDRYWTGPTTRISPEAPVPVVRINQEQARAGGAANVALNVQALGGQALLLGVIGRDEAGKSLQAQLDGIACYWQYTQHAPTITKLRVLSRNQQLIRLDFEESLSVQGTFDRAALVQQYQSLLSTCDVVVLSDYGKGTLCDVQSLIQAAKAANKPVLIDPKGSDYRPYAGATLLTPNLSEFEAVVGTAKDDAAITEKGEALRQQLPLAALLVTRSEQGMTLLQPDQAPLHLPTEAREVFDVTGAGDTVIATLATSLAAGCSLAESCRLANTAAGIVVAKIGTATASPSELQAALSKGEPSLVLEEDALFTKVRQLQAQGQTVVFTNGCFDLLHVGHVRYLEAARKLGDVLVVAVNTDLSVKRLKGESRPLNTTEDRMAMLAALKCVDYVVPFGEDTPQRLIEKILPNKLVKGGDYQPEQIAGFEAVTQNGGQVLCLDFYEGYSTTKLVEKAKGRP